MLRSPHILPPLLTLGMAASLAWWTLAPTHTPGVVASARTPGLDRPPDTASTAPATDLRGTFTKGPASPTEIPANLPHWPAFRGPDANAIAPSAPTLDTSLAAVKRLWQITTGEGYAGAAVHNGRAYLLDYDPATKADVLRCLALNSGHELWRRSYPNDVKRNHGMSRTVPAVNASTVLTLGPKCHVLALDPATGDFLWGKDLVHAYGTKVPPWYAGQCPLLDGDRAILAPAGPDALLVALNAATGEEIWRTPNPAGWTMTHTSILKATIADTPMYIYSGSGGVAGIHADTGQILWSTDQWRVNMAAVASPVHLGGNRILLTGGYGAGALLLDITHDNNTFTPTLVKRFTPQELGAEQQTPIYFQDHIYAVIPGGELVCLDRDGNRKWSSGGAHRFGLGPFLIVNNTLLALDDRGTLAAIAADPAAFTLKGRTRLIPDGHECWGPMALVGTRLIARDLTHVLCVDLAKPEAAHD